MKVCQSFPNWWLSIARSSRFGDDMTQCFISQLFEFFHGPLRLWTPNKRSSTRLLMPILVWFAPPLSPLPWPCPSLRPATPSATPSTDEPQSPRWEYCRREAWWSDLRWRTSYREEGYWSITPQMCAFLFSYCSFGFPIFPIRPLLRFCYYLRIYLLYYICIASKSLIFWNADVNTCNCVPFAFRHSYFCWLFVT
jgi:hypothetical protein